jgi:hypothetical protein
LLVAGVDGKHGSGHKSHASDKHDDVGDLLESHHYDDLLIGNAPEVGNPAIGIPDELSDDDPLTFLREREIVHFQRFGTLEDEIPDELIGSAPEVGNPAVGFPEDLSKPLINILLAHPDPDEEFTPLINILLAYADDFLIPDELIGSAPEVGNPAVGIPYDEYKREPGGYVAIILDEPEGWTGGHVFIIL